MKTMGGSLLSFNFFPFSIQKIMKIEIILLLLGIIKQLEAE